MNIGIFGDSFADNNKANPTKNWIEVVADHFNVTCFGRSGTSLYYSLKLLEENYSKFNKCVLIATWPGRTELSSRALFSLLDNNTRNTIRLELPSLSQCEYQIEYYKKQNNNSAVKAFEAARDYFVYLHDDKKEQYIHNALVEYAKNKFSNLLIIKISDCLVDVFQMENKIWNIEKKKHQFDYNDLRNCHMTEANNIIFGNKVVEMLQGKEVTLRLKDFVKPVLEDKNFYIKTL